MTLKEKLISTGLFIDNEQLDKYIKVVSVNVDDVKYLEKHHILPRSYFKLVGYKIDNSSDNIVKLSYFNHILAHYYLIFCTKNKLRQANIGAFMMLVDTGLTILNEDEKLAIEHLAQYAEIQELAKINKQKQCAKVGKIKTEKHKQALKAARDFHTTTKGKKAIYNEKLNKVKYVFESELAVFLDAGWIVGGKPLSKEAKEKIGRGNSQALRGKAHQKVKNGKLNSGLTFNRVMCIETGQIFENIECAKLWLQKTVGIDGSQIKNCCAGARETTGGYHWEFVKNKETK